jgi:FAD/FMN-containing dehydrogenase
LAAPSPWYVLIEATGGRHANLEAIVEGAMADALAKGLVSDAVVASSAGQAAALWKLRESISEAQKREGASIKHDVSVPVAAIPAFLAKATPAISISTSIRPPPAMTRRSWRSGMRCSKWCTTSSGNLAARSAPSTALA